jgi:ABC-type amino acid transport substrate-binding protein
MKHTRTFLFIEAFAFGTAALVHAGMLTDGYRHHEAMIAESVIAGVLTLGLAVSVLSPRSGRAVGLAVQGFALLGTLVGVFTIVIGIGPQSRFDVALHAGLIALLITGLTVVARRRAHIAPNHV